MRQNLDFKTTQVNRKGVFLQFVPKASTCVVMHYFLLVLFQARLFDEPQLASLCLENIDKNTGDALAAEGFTDIDLGNAALLILTVVIITTLI